MDRDKLQNIVAVLTSSETQLRFCVFSKFTGERRNCFNLKFRAIILKSNIWMHLIKKSYYE